MLLGETKIGEGTSDLTLVGWRNLLTGDGLVERWWTTDKDVVLGISAWNVGLQPLLGDVTGLSLDTGVLLVEEVGDLDSVRVLRGNLVELLLEQNVVSGLVTVNQVDLGLFLWVLGDLVEKLVQWSDTGTTTNQGNLLKLIWLQWPLNNWTLDGNGVVLLKAKEVVTHLTSLVLLDDKFNSTGLLGVGDWGVWTDNVVTLLGDILEEDTGCSDETRLLVWGLEGKGEFSSVWGNVLELGELKVDPLVLVLEGDGWLVVGNGGEAVGNDAGSSKTDGTGDDSGSL